ncbi:unnamed protein product [Psylliodes chrysocephalus]|uniref:Uncharacterized protein n=1 Tax=Psylliodes chrysocephalus TaxID=3402493 RepID=A0A9P0D414_9CUCU|nr:unnamed protein product [Psylliodes chrysocephala]
MLLSGLLSQESHNRSFSEKNIPYDHEDDITEMELSIKEVNTEKFIGNKSDPSFKRINSRLVHLSNRVANLKVDSDEEVTAQNTIKTKIIMLEADLSEKINNNSSSFNSSTVSTEQVSCPSYISVDVHKWGVFYNGNN